MKLFLFNSVYRSLEGLENYFMGIERITPARFDEIMDAIHRDCESVPCEATARKVLEQLKIEIADEIIPYDNLQAFNNLKPGGYLYSKTEALTAIKIHQLIFLENDWRVILLIKNSAKNVTPDDLAKGFIHTANRRPCGVIKS